MIIEETTLQYYLADNTALNIIPVGVLSGDWHPAVHVVPDRTGRIELAYAGNGCEAVYNTNEVFGEYGIYDCCETLVNMGYDNLRGRRVYASDHVRTVLDQFVYYCLKKGSPVNMLGVEGLFDVASLRRLKKAADKYLSIGNKMHPAYIDLIYEIDYARAA
jgi:hypothetical protein